MRGNVSNAREPKDPDPNWVPQINHETGCDDRHALPFQAAAVETRAQKIKTAKNLRPLKVPQAESFTETRTDIQKVQHEDPTLNKLWKLAEIGQTRITGKENETKFLIQMNFFSANFSLPQWNTAESSIS